MKTSNKILLGTLLTVLLILTGIHVAMYAKYKSGDFTTQIQESFTDTVVIKPVRFVRLTGLNNVVIEPSGTSSITKAKEMPAEFKYTLVGDTLVISGFTSSFKDGKEVAYEGMFEQVSLRLPELEKVFVEKCSIRLLGATDSTLAINYRFELSGSILDVQQQFPDKPGYFKNLEVNATGNSKIGMQDDQINIESLSCSLVNSSLEDAPRPMIGKILLNPDDQSVIQLNGTNLKKLKTVVGNNTATAP